jgi:hypothetical protein
MRLLLPLIILLSVFFCAEDKKDINPVNINDSRLTNDPLLQQIYEIFRDVYSSFLTIITSTGTAKCFSPDLLKELSKNFRAAPQSLLKGAIKAANGNICPFLHYSVHEQSILEAMSICCSVFLPTPVQGDIFNLVIHLNTIVKVYQVNLVLALNNECSLATPELAHTIFLDSVTPIVHILKSIFTELSREFSFNRKNTLQSCVDSFSNDLHTIENFLTVLSTYESTSDFLKMPGFPIPGLKDYVASALFKSPLTWQHNPTFVISYVSKIFHFRKAYDALLAIINGVSIPSSTFPDQKDLVTRKHLIELCSSLIEAKSELVEVYQNTVAESNFLKTENKCLYEKKALAIKESHNFKLLHFKNAKYSETKIILDERERDWIYKKRIWNHFKDIIQLF